MKYLKRFLLVFVTILIVVIAAALSSSALDATGQCGDNVYWSFDEATGALTISGTGEMENHIWTVSPFYNHSEIKSVLINGGVTSIRNGAFSHCSNLMNVTIGKNVTIIGDEAFNDCSSLMSVTIGENTTTIGEKAFYHCIGLIDLTIPDFVTNIGFGSFMGCCSLKSVKLPAGLTDISSSLFYDCSSLENVIIPDGVISIDIVAFHGCSSMKSVFIPDSVESIGKGAFEDCSSLISVSIPDDITSVNERTFSNCNSLTKVELPDGATDFGKMAFYGCSSLKSITIPDSVISIGDYAFCGCSSLLFVTVPDSVTSIGYQGFGDCTSLMSVTLSEGMTSIERSAFYRCSNLKRAMIPASVTTIEYSALPNYTTFTDIYYTGTAEQWNSISGYEYFSNKVIHYNCTGDELLATERCIGYCTNNTTDTLTIDGTVYQYIGGNSMEAYFYANQFLLYEIDINGLITKFKYVPATEGFFEDLDYNNKTLTASGETYSVSDACLNSAALLSFNASLDQHFGDKISMVVNEVADNGIAKKTVLAFSYKYTASGVLTGAYSSNGKKYVEIDHVSHVCTDDFNAASDYLNQTVDYYVSNGMVYSVLLHVNKQPSQGYGRSSWSGSSGSMVSKNEAMRTFLDDVLNEIDNYLTLVKKRVGKKIGVDFSDPGSEITKESLAEELKTSDLEGKSTHVTMDVNTPDDYIDAAYLALAEIYIDYIRDTEFDFSDINVKQSGITFAIKLVNAVINGMKGTGTYNNIKIGDFRINISLTSPGKAYSGPITVSKKSGKKYTGWVSSSQDDTMDVFRKYYADLQDIVENELDFAVYSFAQEFFNVTGLTQMTEDAIRERYEKIINRLTSDEAKKFTKIITTAIYNNTPKISAALDWIGKMKKAFAISGKVPESQLETAIESLGWLKDGLDESGLLDRATKKSMQTLKSKLQRMISVWHDYVAGRDVEYKPFEEETSALKKAINKLGELIFQCPVEFEIYNENGALIGYVRNSDDEEEYVWYSDDIEIIVSGDSKFVYFPADMNLSIKTVATDNGLMTYYVEMSDNGNASGRLVYYDIPLIEGQTYTQCIAANTDLLKQRGELYLVSEETLIRANAYYSAAEDATVHIALESSEGGAVKSEGEYVKGDKAIVVATADEGYIFSGWYSDGIKISNDLVYRFPAKEDLTLYANFEKCAVLNESFTVQKAKAYSETEIEICTQSDGTLKMVIYDPAELLAGKLLTVFGRQGTDTAELFDAETNDVTGAYYFRDLDASYDVYTVKDAEGNTVVSAYAEGAELHTPGDINGDGKLNNKDLNRLMKYLAGDDVDVVEDVLDINGDGNVNNKDLNRLMKYLAGEDVEIF